MAASIVRILVALAFTVAVWGLPPGDRLWPAALWVAVGPALVSRVMKVRAVPAGYLGAGYPGTVFAGLGAFCAVVPYVNLPYRPEVLFSVLGVGVLVAYAVAFRQLVGRGVGAGQAGLVMGIALGVGGVLAGLGWAL